MNKVLVFAATLVLLTGCATVLDSDVQAIRVIATCNGKSVPAQCSLENNQGLWEVNAPGSVNVQKDSSALRVRCQSPFFKGGATQLNPGLNSLLAGNALIGGFVGVGVDAMTGKGFSYNPVVKVAYSDCR
jgi:hypothetical protein